MGKTSKISNHSTLTSSRTTLFRTPTKGSYKMLPFQRLLRSRALFRAGPVISRNLKPQRRTLVAPPKPGDGPLMARRADRELPDIPENGMKWVRTIPIFLVILISSTLGIFNYQKSSSSVVSSTMYALRTSQKAREYLGEEIYFKSQMPWIWGEMNMLHRKIDLLDGSDPFKGIELDEEEPKKVGRGSYAPN